MHAGGPPSRGSMEGGAARPVSRQWLLYNKLFSWKMGPAAAGIRPVRNRGDGLPVRSVDWRLEGSQGAPPTPGTLAPWRFPGGRPGRPPVKFALPITSAEPAPSQGALGVAGSE